MLTKHRAFAVGLTYNQNNDNIIGIFHSLRATVTLFWKKSLGSLEILSWGPVLSEFRNQFVWLRACFDLLKLPRHQFSSIYICSFQNSIQEVSERKVRSSLKEGAASDIWNLIIKGIHFVCYFLSEDPHFISQYIFIALSTS